MKNRKKYLHLIFDNDDNMEKFTQRVNYACIVPFRNYSLLSEKKYSFGTTYNLDLDDLDEEGLPFNPDQDKDGKNPSLGRIYTLPKFKHKNTCFFTSDKNTSYSGRLDIPYPGKKMGLRQYYTDKSHQIKRHFADPFSRITVYTYEKSIRITDDKIILKYYKLTKHRNFNSRFFSKDSISSTLSIDMKTGNFTVGKKNGKKYRQVFIKNHFGLFLNEFIRCFLFDIDIDRKIKNPFYDKLLGINPIENIINELNEILGFDIDIDNITNSFLDNLISFFIEKRKIKVPNGEIRKYFIDMYPTEKFFKKNDRKLISSSLDMLGFKSKLTIKLLHLYPKLNIVSLYMLCNILGPNYSKYIGNLHNISFSDGKETHHLDIKYAIFNYKTDFELTDIERENIISMINSMKKPYFSNDNIILLEDHLRMIKNISKYVPDIFFKSRTEEEFKKNHKELSELNSKIKKGWSIEYIFAPKMVDDVEKPITLTIDNTSFAKDLFEITPNTVNVTFYPYILKREEEYVEEGQFMHHCVASYAKKDKSIIISLRTYDSSDRVTCEYNGQDGRLTQSRHFCNASPPADMEMAIEELTIKVKKYARLGMLHAIEQKKVPVRINGVDITIEEPTNPYTFIEF